jgi:hypothetical protein
VTEELQEYKRRVTALAGKLKRVHQELDDLYSNLPEDAPNTDLERHIHNAHAAMASVGRHLAEALKRGFYDPAQYVRNED